MNSTSDVTVKHMSNPVFNLRHQISYTNEIFYSENSSISNLHSDSKEHVYLEIDENFLRQRQGT